MIKKHCLMCDLVEFEERERVGTKYCLRDMQEPCRAKRLYAPESVSEAVSLGV